MNPSEYISTYRGVFPIAPTPFLENGALDPDSQKRVLDCMVDQGVDGICILANYSEQFLLTDEERDTLLELCLNHVAGRVPWEGGQGGGIMNPPPRSIHFDGFYVLRGAWGTHLRVFYVLCGAWGAQLHVFYVLRGAWGAQFCVFLVLKIPISPKDPEHLHLLKCFLFGLVSKSGLSARLVHGIGA